MADTSLINRLHGMARYNLDLRETSNEFFPQNGDYRDSMAVVAAAGILPAVAVLVYIVVFNVSRFCFNCCGGRKPTAGCCCPRKDADRRVYKERTLHKLHSWFFLFCALTSGAIIVGTLGGYRFHNDLEDVTQAALQRTTFINFYITQEKAIVDLAGTATTQLNADLVAMTSESGDITDHVNDAVNDIYSDFEDWRNKFVYCILALITLVLLIGFFAAGSWNGNVAFWTVTQFGSLVLMATLVYGGVQFAFMTINADVCSEVVAWLAAGAGTMPSAALQRLTPCLNQTTLDSISTAMNTLRSDALATLNTLCNGGACSPAFTLANYRQIRTDPQFDTNNSDQANDLIDEIADYTNALSVHENIDNCAVWREYYSEQESVLCNEMFDDQTFLLSAALAVSLFLFIAGVISIIGKKRWVIYVPPPIHGFSSRFVSASTLHRSQMDNVLYAGQHLHVTPQPRSKSPTQPPSPPQSPTGYSPSPGRSGGGGMIPFADAVAQFESHEGARSPMPPGNRSVSSMSKAYFEPGSPVV